MRDRGNFVILHLVLVSMSNSSIVKKTVYFHLIKHCVQAFALVIQLSSLFFCVTVYLFYVLITSILFLFPVILKVRDMLATRVLGRYNLQYLAELALILKLDHLFYLLKNI